MGKRHDARKLAVSVLYCVDVLKVSSEETWEIIGTNNYSEVTVKFARELVEGTLKNIEFIDNIIVKYAKNWEMDRIAHVDKGIIRLGLYEIYFEDSIPRNVSINEAVELAKYFSGSKSHKFVNGLLDAGTREIKKAVKS